MDARYIQTKDGSEIEGLDVIRDGDILYCFTNKGASHSHTLNAVSAILQSPGSTASEEVINQELNNIFRPSSSNAPKTRANLLVRSNKRLRKGQEGAPKIIEKRLVCLRSRDSKAQITLNGKNIIADGQISFTTASSEFEIRHSIFDILSNAVSDCCLSDFEFVHINSKIVTKIITKPDYEWNGKNVAALCDRGALYVQLAKSENNISDIGQSLENHEFNDLSQEMSREKSLNS